MDHVEVAKIVLESGICPESDLSAFLAWYEWSEKAGFLVVERDEKGICGFLDFIRIPEIPKSVEHSYDLFNAHWRESHFNKVVFIMNCVVLRGKDTMKNLKNRVIQMNNDAEHLSFHSRKFDQIRSHKI